MSDGNGLSDDEKAVIIGGSIGAAALIGGIVLWYLYRVETFRKRSPAVQP